jgi:hypothetical protein
LNSSFDEYSGKLSELSVIRKILRNHIFLEPEEQ